MTEPLNAPFSPLEVNAEAANPSTFLSAEKHQTLGELEKTIAKGEGSFVETGLSLATIRDGNLHLEAGYQTFEAYCRGRWGFTRQRACQLIGGAETAKHLATIVNTVSPTNEGQVRQLAGRSLDEAAEIWKLANSMAAGAPVTGRLVKQAIKQIFGEVPKPEKPLADLLKSVARTCRCLTEQFSECDLRALNHEDKSILLSAVQAVLRLNIKAGGFDPPPGLDRESLDRIAAGTAAIRALRGSRTEPSNTPLANPSSQK